MVNPEILGSQGHKKNELKVPTDLLLFLGIIISLITYLNLNTLSKSTIFSIILLTSSICTYKVNITKNVVAYILTTLSDISSYLISQSDNYFFPLFQQSSIS